jgi:hypothetical protein
LNIQAFVQYNALLHLKQETVFIDEQPDNAGKVMRQLISGHKYIEIAVSMEIPMEMTENDDSVPYMAIIQHNPTPFDKAKVCRPHA